MSALYRSRRRLGALVVTSSLVLAGFAVLIARPADAASTDVVITEVYGGGGNSGAPYQNDFVELTNNSSAPVDVSGWSIQYASSGGSTWQVTNLTGTIAPGSRLSRPGGRRRWKRPAAADSRTRPGPP